LPLSSAQARSLLPASHTLQHTHIPNTHSKQRPTVTQRDRFTKRAQAHTPHTPVVPVHSPLPPPPVTHWRIHHTATKALNPARETTVRRSRN
jgi:hypothetical protein